MTAYKNTRGLPDDSLTITVKLQAVDWSTIQFWNFWAKGYSTEGSNFPFKSLLKPLGCATNQDSLLLTTLRYATNVWQLPDCGITA